jgi:hypothetical protein
LTEGLGFKSSTFQKVHFSIAFIWAVDSAQIFPGMKRQGREAGHSPETTAEIKETWMYIFTPQYAFLA